MGTYYHVTTLPSAEKIMVDGFRPSDRFNPMGKGIYLWNDIEWAENYVWDGWMNQLDGRWFRAPDRLDVQPAIIQVDLTPLEETRLLPFRAAADPWNGKAVVYPRKRTNWRPQRELIDASYVLDLPGRPIPEAP